MIYISLQTQMLYGNSDAVAERMRITSAGNVGIGTTSPDGKLSVTGNILYSNSGTVRSNDALLSDTDLIFVMQMLMLYSYSIIFKESNYWNSVWMVQEGYFMVLLLLLLFVLQLMQDYKYIIRCFSSYCEIIYRVW